MKLAVSYDAEGNILTLFDPEALRTDAGLFSYVPAPGEQHRVLDLPKELEGTPFRELPEMLRVNAWGQLPRLGSSRRAKSQRADRWRSIGNAAEYLKLLDLLALHGPVRRLNNHRRPVHQEILRHRLELSANQHWNNSETEKHDPTPQSHSRLLMNSGTSSFQDRTRPAG
jgi:hypothetical protein